ncbi:MAG: glutamine amidotransferase, partial [Deferrisomatales bacterium]
LITFLILRTPQDLNLVPQEELSLIPFPTKELFSEELHTFDAVVLANFDYAPYVPEQFLANLSRYVRDDGGGLAFLGGDRSFGLAGYQATALAEVLPLEFSGAAPGQGYLPGRFRPRLTDAGAAHPLFQWRPTAEGNRAAWNDLPELEGANWVLRPRTGAVVLAENPAARNEHGPMPVVALGEYGAGRTLAVATDSLWHWALPAAGRGGDEAAYRDFWTRALRWLVHDPEMALVRLALPAGTVRAGGEVVLRARVLDRAYAPARGAAVRGKLVGEGGAQVALAWAEAGPGEYAARPVRLPAPGLWRAEVEAEAAGALLGRDAAEFPVEPPSPEGLRPGVDRAYLEALARDSGGAVFRPGDRALWDLLAAKGEAEVEVVGRRVHEAWATAPLLALSILLFGLDWLLRRWWE